MASLSVKFLLVTVLVHLSLVILAVHAEEEEDAELKTRGAKNLLRKIFNCKKPGKLNKAICKKLQKGQKGAAAPPAADTPPVSDAPLIGITAPPERGAA